MEQYLEDSVGLASLGASAPSPSLEKSYGIDPDYRFGAVLVRRRWILGPSSWSLVGSELFAHFEASSNWLSSHADAPRNPRRELSGVPKHKSIAGPMKSATDRACRDCCHASFTCDAEGRKNEEGDATEATVSKNR
jgi:hypothetical protein